MSTNKTNAWDAIVSVSPGIIILLFCLGIGGCCYLLDSGAAKRDHARVEERK